MCFIFSIIMSSNAFSQEFRLKYSDDRLSDKMILNKEKPTRVDLELGDTLKSIVIEGEGEYIVIQQTETSVTIMNEGPHYDLVDWKHGYSKKMDLLKKGNEHFYLDHKDKIEFPKVDLSELVKEAKRVGGEQYETIAKQCKSPKDYPCGVSPSKHIFWIKEKVKGKKNHKELGVIELIIPMGC